MLGRTLENTDGLVSSTYEPPQSKRTGTEPDSKAEVHNGEEFQMLRQPKTISISPNNLQREIKDIYTRLKRAEAKCINGNY